MVYNAMDNKITTFIYEEKNHTTHLLVEENTKMAKAKEKIEYNIAGIDVGSANSKDNLGNIFKSQIREIKNPLGEKETIEINGKQYAYGRGDYSNKADAKFKETNFIPLLITLLAKNAPDKENHKIVVGLPINQYAEYGEELQATILEHKENVIRLDGEEEERTIRIVDVVVFPEGMGVLYSLSDEDFEEIGHRKKCLIVEIGGKTTDTLLMSQGQYEDREMEDFLTIPDTGTLKVYGDLKEYIEKKHGTYNLEWAKQIVEGELDLTDKHGNDVDLEEVIEGFKDYRFNLIISDLRHKYPALSTLRILLCGGGAEMYETRFREEFENNLFVNHNIHANAEGYKAYGDSVFGE